MSPGLSAEGVVTGNTYDKYGSSNPVVRRLMSGFEEALDELLERADPESLLDIGCGEGVLTQRWAMRLPGRRIVGADLDDPTLRAEWTMRSAPNLDYVALIPGELPFGDGEFDLVSAIEVLEHVPDPEQTLAEMARCARRHLLVSVPREPMWRMLNIARGAYWAALGNTPGHLNHWSKRAFLRLADQHGEVSVVRSPPPWTMLLVRV
jgi:2-polyprenyl-3-methyl-5-hydroxy-6-metoxy-1,4-benzoquinol methylase